MAEIAGLLFPFFGLILIGYIAAKVTKQPAEALGWLNTFIVYAALPALFFKLVSRTPVEDLARIDFIVTDLAATYSIFIAIFVIGRFIRKSRMDESTIQAFAGAYGNIGYMGPGLALIAFGDRAAVPVALIVCLENALHFIVAPAMMAAAGDDKRSRGQIAADILRKMPEKTRATLEASCRGVNAFISEHKGRYPMEFDALGYAPEPWTPERSVLISRLLAWELNTSYWTDIVFGDIQRRVDSVRFSQILPYYPSDAPTIIPGGQKPEPLLEQLNAPPPPPVDTTRSDSTALPDSATAGKPASGKPAGGQSTGKPTAGKPNGGKPSAYAAPARTTPASATTATRAPPSWPTSTPVSARSACWRFSRSQPAPPRAVHTCWPS